MIYIPAFSTLQTQTLTVESQPLYLSQYGLCAELILQGQGVEAGRATGLKNL